MIISLLCVSIVLQKLTEFVATWHCCDNEVLRVRCVSILFCLTTHFRAHAISSFKICGSVAQDEEASEVEKRATLQTVNKRLLAQIEEQVTKL